MKSYHFSYVECSMFGEFPRLQEIKARTEASARKKLSQICGNRDFQNITLVSVR